MPLILSGNVASALGTGYDVANSCRFYSNTRLSRTTGVTTTNTKFTLSFWIKMCDITNHQMIFETYKADGEYLSCGFNLDNAVQPRFYIQEYTGSYIFRKIFTRLSRDMSAWSHYCIKYDSTEGESTRLRVYVNGTEDTVTTTANLPSSNATSIISVGTQYIGYSENQSGHYLHAYLAEFVLVEGTDYAPTDFAEYSEESPTIWIPKDVSGLTFGTNGFYLDFEDSGDLGDDESGNGHDFTETNLAAADQATDTPTNSFATWNPLADYYYAGSYAEGNCQTTTGSSEYGYLPATIGVSSGKWYCEIEWDAKSGGGGAGQIGITSTQSTASNIQLGQNAHDYAWYGPDGKVYNNNDGDTITAQNTYTTGDIVGIYLDLDNNKLYFSKNGTLESSTGISITDPASTPLGFYFFAVCYPSGSYTGTYKANFGGCPAFAISSGNTDGEYGNFEYSTTITGDGASKTFKALCTKNLGSDGG